MIALAAKKNQVDQIEKFIIKPSAAKVNYSIKLEKNNELDLYFEHIQRLVSPKKINNKIKFGVDGGNGAIGSIFEDLSTIYNFDCEKLYMEVDGNFPNHPADPSNIDNLKDIIKLVLEKKLDFGVAFDGDADRAVFIDDTGKVVSGSMMTTLIADYLSEKKDNLKIVHNVNVSPSVVNYLKKKGITTIRAKVGHSYIKQIMREEDADFGGEHSAHFYLKENYYADSGIVTLLIFLQILSEKNVKASELIDSYNFPPTSGEINFEVISVKESLEKIENSFENSFDKLDGISYFDEKYWFNVRGSNTEPKLRLNAEAEDEETLNNLINEITNIIKV